MADSVTVRAVLCADGSVHVAPSFFDDFMQAPEQSGPDPMDGQRPCGPHYVAERTITTSPWVKVEEKCDV